MDISAKDQDKWIAGLVAAFNTLSAATVKEIASNSRSKNSSVPLCFCVSVFGSCLIFGYFAADQEECLEALFALCNSDDIHSVAANKPQLATTATATSNSNNSKQQSEKDAVCDAAGQATATPNTNNEEDELELEDEFPSPLIQQDPQFLIDCIAEVFPELALSYIQR